MIKNEAILASIYMIQDYQKGSHFLEETVDRVVNELKLLDAELESLQSRSCESCRFVGYRKSDGCSYCELNNTVYCDPAKENFCCNRYEAKEQL